METSTYGGAAVLSGARAGFWRRFAGAFIDGIVVGIASGILKTIVGTGVGTGLGLLIGAVYFTAFIGAERGQTLGRWVSGIRLAALTPAARFGSARGPFGWS